MTPYGSFAYFGLLLYVVIPLLIARACDVPPRRFILGATAVVLFVQYGLTPTGRDAATLRVIGTVIAFAFGQWVVAKALLHRRRSRAHRLTFYVAIGCALLPLLLVRALPQAAHRIGFVGLSYLTFRALDVIFDIQDGLVKELPTSEYLAFLLFFPAISAGPIDRYRRFRGDYRRERTRGALVADLDAATEHLFRGLLYGFVLRPLIDVYWMTPASHHRGVLHTISYMYAYSLHLFFDFAGYSAFAIGVGYALGIRMPENFNRPFLATNIVEFWNRWHISLSSWLRDHVYGRFVLTALRKRWFTDRRTAAHLGSLLTFGLMGLWHGFEPRYVGYGLYHAALVIGYGVLTQSRHAGRLRVPPIVARVVTFHLVCFGFLIFSGRLI